MAQLMCVEEIQKMLEPLIIIGTGKRKKRYKTDEVTITIKTQSEKPSYSRLCSDGSSKQHMFMELKPKNPSSIDVKGGLLRMIIYQLDSNCQIYRSQKMRGIAKIVNTNDDILTVKIYKPTIILEVRNNNQINSQEWKRYENSY